MQVSDKNLKIINFLSQSIIERNVKMLTKIDLAKKVFLSDQHRLLHIKILK